MVDTPRTSPRMPREEPSHAYIPRSCPASLPHKPSKDDLGTSSFTSPWPERPLTPTSAGPPAPYETPVYIPPSLHTSASAPAPGHAPAPKHAQMAVHGYLSRPPLTPPDSFEGELPQQDSRDAAPKIIAIPGTMSSRSTPPDRRPRSLQRPPRSVPGKEPHSRSFVRRFKAFVEMFKKEPVDENDFERIGDKHWADED